MTTNTEAILSSRRWYWLAALGIVAYCITVLQLADNTPKFDDLNDVFGFFKQLAIAQTLPQKAGAFFYPNNEHVTLINHLAYFAEYQLMGEIRFYPLILLGHAIIIITGCLIGSCINSERKPFFFTVITLGYINLLYWDSSFKAMTAISNQAVILFAVASLFSLQRLGNLYSAIILALCATFSQGNGVVIWPVGAYLLLTESAWDAHRKKATIVWLLFSFIAIGGYLLAKHLWMLPSTPPTEPLPQQLMQRLRDNPTAAALSIPAFLGATFFDIKQTAFAVFTGSLGMLLWSRLLPHRRNFTLLYSIVLFLLGSALISSSMRGLIYGTADAVVASRYKMYSLAFLLLTLTALAEFEKSKTLKTVAASAALLLAIFCNLSSYNNIPAIREQAEKFQKSYANWIVDGDVRRQAIYFPPMSDHFLFVADYLHLLNFRAFTTETSWLVLEKNAPVSSACTEVATPGSGCALSASHRGNGIVVKIDAILPAAIQNGQLLLCPQTESGIQSITSYSASLAANDKHWLIAQEQLPAGNYRVLLTNKTTPLCETVLTKKTRKVEMEMLTLLGPQE